jgi:molybdopterin synthase catalytic subunit
MIFQFTFAYTYRLAAPTNATATTPLKKKEKRKKKKRAAAAAAGSSSGSRSKDGVTRRARWVLGFEVMLGACRQKFGHFHSSHKRQRKGCCVMSGSTLNYPASTTAPAATTAYMATSSEVDPLAPYSTPSLPQTHPDYFHLEHETELYTTVLTSKPITYESVAEALRDMNPPSTTTCNNGAMSSFLGLTRSDTSPTDPGQVTTSLSYETYPKLYIKTFHDRITPKIKPGCKLLFLHRCYGPPCGVSEISVLVAVTGGHRREVLDTLDNVVEGMKAWLPVWKNECYESEAGTSNEWKTNDTWAYKDDGVK